MNLKVEWNKIVVNALSVLVATVIVGAGAIVWDRAASVDEKIQDNRKDIDHLISSLSDKLALYEVQLVSISNQLSILTRNKSTNELSSDAAEIHQKARSKDIQQQFKR